MNKNVTIGKKKNCGDKHDKTTHVVKTWIYKLNVSYASTYIFRSDRWGKNANKYKRNVKDWYLIRKMKYKQTDFSMKSAKQTKPS